MSAQLLILPRIHATASFQPTRTFTEGALARAAHALHQLAHEGEEASCPIPRGPVALGGTAPKLRAQPATQPFQPGIRKGPHRLQLVQAAAAPATPAPVRELPTGRRQVSAAQVNGVALEFYRVYTEAMLRRYSRLSMESGRVPSLLGREMFRGHVTSCKVHSFEDVSNFVHDMERAMQQLTPGERHLARRIAVEEYTQAETAGLCGLSLRTVVRHYAGALDKLTRVLLDRKLLEPLSPCSC